ncbi:hypothetical protein BDW22DRAFT_431116 [Trametopsis cervina]|nr:hypothetical protein BDW22DRAFT_431116 [Trametopsis cervina]
MRKPTMLHLLLIYLFVLFNLAAPVASAPAFLSGSHSKPVAEDIDIAQRDTVDLAYVYALTAACIPTRGVERSFRVGSANEHVELPRSVTGSTPEETALIPGPISQRPSIDPHLAVASTRHVDVDVDEHSATTTTTHFEFEFEFGSGVPVERRHVAEVEVADGDDAAPRMEDATVPYSEAALTLLCERASPSTHSSGQFATHTQDGSTSTWTRHLPTGQIVALVACTEPTDSSSALSRRLAKLDYRELAADEGATPAPRTTISVRAAETQSPGDADVLLVEKASPSSLKSATAVQNTADTNVLLAEETSSSFSAPASHTTLSMDRTHAALRPSVTAAAAAESQRTAHVSLTETTSSSASAPHTTLAKLADATQSTAHADVLLAEKPSTSSSDSTHSKTSASTTTPKSNPHPSADVAAADSAEPSSSSSEKPHKSFNWKALLAGGIVALCVAAGITSAWQIILDALCPGLGSSCCCCC